jgi:glycosyltransferase involved in cell wall biosynthesis
MILHVIPYLWSGAGNVVTRLCEAQCRCGPVAIVTAGRRGDHPDWPAYRARLRRAGVEHDTIDFFHRDSETYWRSVAALRDLVGRMRPSIIHAHAGVPACAAAMVRAAAGPRVRVIGHMYSWGPNRPEWMNQQDAWGFTRCDRVVVSAHAYWTMLEERGVPAKKLVYVPWGLPLDALTPRATRRGERSGAPRIGFVGRIEPRKGQLTLVRAFARIVQTFPDARLTLVGPVADPDYAAAVRSAVDRHSLNHAVTLTGAVRDAPRHMRRWNLFVSLSSDEGQGLAVLEAMALGVPVAARPVAGISDFLSDGETGMAVAGASVTAAATTMRDALSNPARMAAIATRARRLVERRYSWERTVRVLEGVYGRSGPWSSDGAADRRRVALKADGHSAISSMRAPHE